MAMDRSSRQALQWPARGQQINFLMDPQNELAKWRNGLRVSSIKKRNKIGRRSSRMGWKKGGTTMGCECTY